MAVSRFGIVLLAASVSTLAGQIVTGVIGRPLPSAQEMANLESHVLQNPGDIDARVQLLQFYLNTAPPLSPSARWRRPVRGRRGSGITQ